MSNSRIIAGDCIERMKMLDKESIDHIITDPPYELGFMGKCWDNSGVAYNPKTWKAAHRVLKPNGVMLVFGATRTHHRIADAIKRAGFEIVDIIAWTYGTGFPKSHNISKAIDKRGGEDVSWFGAWLKKWRLDNDIKQREVSKLFPSKTGGLTGCVSNWELGFNLPTNEQFNLICKTFDLPFTSLEEAKGKFIGTITHQRSGGEDFAKQVGSKSQERIEEVFALGTNNAKQWEGWGTALKPAWEPIIIAKKKGGNFTMTDSYSQFHYIPKAGKKERNRGLEDFEDKKKYNDFGLKERIENGETTNSRTNKEASQTKNTHPTVKPVNLMKKLVEDFTVEGSTVLDPFTGSGSTGIACVLTNRRFVGIELTPEYIPLAKTRITHAEENPEGWT